MGYCIHETSMGCNEAKRNNQRVRKRTWGSQMQWLKEKNPVEGLGDKVSEINLELEPKRQEMEKKREMIRHLKDQLEKPSF